MDWDISKKKIAKKVTNNFVSISKQNKGNLSFNKISIFFSIMFKYLKNNFKRSLSFKKLFRQKNFLKVKKILF